MTVISLSSCASIFCGTSKKVTFDSNVPVTNATLTIDGRKYHNVSFPYVAKVKRGFSSSTVKAECDKYAPTSLVIDKKFNAVSILNFGFILGWGIDAATGAMMKPEYNNYDIEFTTLKNTSNETPNK